MVFLQTTIKISYKVRKLLKKLKQKDQSYNDYIFELAEKDDYMKGILIDFTEFIRKQSLK
jgi:predicted CopG family antitoxin